MALFGREEGGKEKSPLRAVMDSVPEAVGSGFVCVVVEGLCENALDAHPRLAARRCLRRGVH